MDMKTQSHKKQRRSNKKKQRIKAKEIRSGDEIIDKEVAQVSSEEKSFAFFIIGKELFAIELGSILEILHTFNIVSVPHLPKVFSGVINLRNESVPVADLQKLLKEEKIETETKVCLITLIGSSKIGFLVDSDVEIITSEEGKFYPLPDCYTKEEAEFLDGIFWVKDKFIGILKPKEVMETLAEWREDNEKI